MVYKKILAATLVLLLLLPNTKVMANCPNDFQANQTSGRSYSGASWATIIITGTALCLASGCVGYRLGRTDCFSKCKKAEGLDTNKEINLVGPRNADPTVTQAGAHRFELLAIDYIDKLLNIDISKLKTSNEFPTEYLANVDGLCYPVPQSLENIATKKGCRKAHGLALKLKDKGLILQQIIEHEDKISVGYLLDLLNKTKSLLQEAAPLIEENYYS